MKIAVDAHLNECADGVEIIGKVEASNEVPRPYAILEIAEISFYVQDPALLDVLAERSRHLAKEFRAALQDSRNW